MQSTRLARGPLLWCVLACAALTGVVWLTGSRLASVPLLPDQGASWYRWKLPHPTFWTHLTAWAGYLVHQLVSWGLIFYAQRSLRRYTPGLHRLNVIALAANLGFVLLHLLQSQLFYDGLAQDVSIYSSQGSVILLLVVVLLMENSRRGLFVGKKVPISKRIIGFARHYHGYLFSWAIVYTFWYHPMVATPGHLVGFAYMFLLLVQSSLFFTRTHLNRRWTIVLEVMVAGHGALVAYLSHGPHGLWPMFLFGFGAIFVLTQLYGLGLTRRTRVAVTVIYLVAAAAVYGWLGLARAYEITWIPIVEYGLVFVLAGLIGLGLWIAGRIRRAPVPERVSEPVR